jgi:hypothetical protein
VVDSGSAVLGRGGGVAFVKPEDDGGRSMAGGRAKGALAGMLEKRETSWATGGLRVRKGSSSVCGRDEKDLRPRASRGPFYRKSELQHRDRWDWGSRGQDLATPRFDLRHAYLPNAFRGRRSVCFTLEIFNGDEAADSHLLRAVLAMVAHPNVQLSHHIEIEVLSAPSRGRQRSSSKIASDRATSKRVWE